MKMLIMWCTVNTVYTKCIQDIDERERMKTINAIEQFIQI